MPTAKARCQAGIGDPRCEGRCGNTARQVIAVKSRAYQQANAYAAVLVRPCQVTSLDTRPRRVLTKRHGWRSSEPGYRGQVASQTRSERAAVRGVRRYPSRAADERERGRAYRSRTIVGER